MCVFWPDNGGSTGGWKIITGYYFRTPLFNAADYNNKLNNFNFKTVLCHVSNMAFVGRVVIFSIPGCKFCKQAKTLLGNYNIPYHDVDLSKYPERRYEMKERTGRSSVPQIFFNSQHIGGWDDIKLLVRETGKTVFLFRTSSRCLWLILLRFYFIFCYFFVQHDEDKLAGLVEETAEEEPPPDAPLPPPECESPPEDEGDIILLPSQRECKR